MQEAYRSLLRVLNISKELKMSTYLMMIELLYLGTNDEELAHLLLLGGVSEFFHNLVDILLVVAVHSL